VHQAEHHRFGVRPRYALKTVVPHVDRVDVRNYLASVLETLELTGEPLCLRLGAAGPRFLNGLADGVQLPRLGPPERDAPSHAIAHRTANAQIGRTPCDCVAGALLIDGVGLLKALLH